MGFAYQIGFVRLKNRFPGQSHFEMIDDLLIVNESPFSPLQQLKAVPRNPSPTAMLELTNKLEQITATDILDVDLSWLNNNYQRYLTNYVHT